jgi:hypothetical protein
MGGPRVNVQPGDRFGHLVVVEELPQRTCPGGKRKRVMSCRCDCGEVRPVMLANLTSGNTTSCGCFRDKATGDRLRTHGKRHTTEFRVWSLMRNRCSNPRTLGYADYGARGITVCDRWRHAHGGFENFLADMGPRPNGTSLDRRDNDGNYEPGNCRWATRQEQARNKRSNVRLTVDGVTKTAVEWAEVVGIDAKIIRQRVANGWDARRAVMTPVGRAGIANGESERRSA